MTQSRPAPAVNSPAQVLFASLIGTTIEFFDFYIYATAAVLVFPQLFFPASDPAAATLASLATFAHRVPRAADRVGVVRPLRRPRRPQDHARGGAADDGRLDGADWRCCRPTTRSASPRRCCSRCAASARGSGSAASGAARCCWRSRTRRRASARGTACSRSSARRSASSSPAASSCCCRAGSTDEQFFAYGWRIPFLASAVLVLVGLYVRLTITETPVFREALAAARARQGADARRVPRPPGHARLLGTMVVARDVRAVLPDDRVRAVVGHHALGYRGEEFLLMQLFGVAVLRGDDPDLGDHAGRARPAAGRC